MVKVKIINNSSREIPQELTEDMIKPLSEVQQILEEYNLKCHSYEIIYDDDKKLSEQIITINDIK